ncbi:hypothetical protein Aduo_002681 [Ancylostoma duodenale]
MLFLDTDLGYSLFPGFINTMILIGEGTSIACTKASNFQKQELAYEARTRKERAKELHRAFYTDGSYFEVNTKLSRQFPSHVSLPQPSKERENDTTSAEKRGDDYGGGGYGGDSGQYENIDENGDEHREREPEDNKGYEHYENVSDIAKDRIFDTIGPPPKSNEKVEPKKITTDDHDLTTAHKKAKRVRAERIPGIDTVIDNINEKHGRGRKKLHRERVSPAVHEEKHAVVQRKHDWKKTPSRPPQKAGTPRKGRTPQKARNPKKKSRK